TAARDLPSFPTRRSSDLDDGAVGHRIAGAIADGISLGLDRFLRPLDVEVKVAGVGGDLPYYALHRLAAAFQGSYELSRPFLIRRSEEHTSELQSPYDLVC